MNKPRREICFFFPFVEKVVLAKHCARLWLAVISDTEMAFPVPPNFTRWPTTL